MAKVRATRSFERSLRDIPRDVVERILRKAGELEANPLLGKPLRGAYEVVVDGARLRIKLRSLRVGDYRVIYWYDPLRDTAWLILAGHRRSVYKLL